MLFADRIGQCFVSGNQLAAILFQARQQQIDSMRLFGNLVLSGERGAYCSSRSMLYNSSRIAGQRRYLRPLSLRSI